MVFHQSVCCRRLAEGRRGAIVSFSRFLANGRVSVDALIEGWGQRSSAACHGRHILAIQDTSALTFRTTADDRRGLGEIGKGNGHGLLLHAMLGVDAETGSLLGLVTGHIWTRSGRVSLPHGERPLSEKESERWLKTADAAKGVLAQAAMVTGSQRSRERYLCQVGARPARHFPHPDARHARSAHPGRWRQAVERASDIGGYNADRSPGTPPAGPARTARLQAGFAQVTLKRPHNTVEENLPDTVRVTLVEVMEIDTPAGVEPIHWRLLTTHSVEDAAIGLAHCRMVPDALGDRAVLPNP